MNHFLKKTPLEAETNNVLFDNFGGSRYRHLDLMVVDEAQTLFCILPIDIVRVSNKNTYIMYFFPTHTMYVLFANMGPRRWFRPLKIPGLVDLKYL